jgi:hypothetical protein
MIDREDILDFGEMIMGDKVLSKTVNPSIDDSCLYYDPSTGHNCLVGYWLHSVVGIDNEILSSFAEGKTAKLAIQLLQEHGYLEENIEADAVLLLDDMQRDADRASYDRTKQEVVMPLWGDVLASYVGVERGFSAEKGVE